MERLGIYIHIPFCKKKCDYCDFISYCNKDELIESYVESLMHEIEEKNIEINNERKVTSIYIGGGTPSYIDSKYIVTILNNIKEKFVIEKNAEITIEVNPGTVSIQKLKDYKEAGINRMSIGLQSTNDALLKEIGRIHNYSEFIDAFNMARNVGFDNINVDLILAIPNQTETILAESLEKMVNLNPEHVSLYSLIVEDNTILKKRIDNSELELLTDDVERKMYWNAIKFLEKNGYMQYEISNFAKKGFESKHNLDCWNQEEYIGFGVSAHSYINKRRFSNIQSLEKYIENIKSKKFNDNIIVEEEQTIQMQMREYMMLGFRKIDGVSISDFERKFEMNPLFYFRFELEELVNKELIEIDLDNIKLTSKGLDFANLVFEEFI